MAHMHYPILELIMLCKMYMNFESLEKIPKWIKPELGGGGGGERGGGGGGGVRSVGRGR